jgi:hypothetical protein
MREVSKAPRLPAASLHSLPFVLGRLVVLAVLPHREHRRYLRWTGSGGEELWLQLSPRRDLIGMNPHFSGASRVRVGIVNRVTRPSDTKLDGALQAWASPQGDSPEEGAYPFVFDVPDARRSEVSYPARFGFPEG